jgi:alginate O-acetyltransferase complex protein AlgI
MLLGGLWHGANWTFILWGGWHGTLLAIERLLGWGGAAPKAAASRAARTAITILAVMIGWVMFRAAHVETALAFYKGMAGLNGGGITADLRWQMKTISVVALAAGIVVIAVQPWFARYRTPVPLSKESVAMKVEMPLGLQLVTAAFFCLAITRLLAMSYSPFLYFQF